MNPSEFEKSLKGGDRVDVLWRFLQDGVEKKATIARLVIILSPTNKVAVGDDGVLYVDNPKTGTRQRYILKNSRWSLDKSYVPE